MADVTVEVDTDNVQAGRDGSPSNPYDGYGEAWEATFLDIDPGDNYTYNLRGTAEDTYNATVGVLMDGWPTSGAGDVTITVQGDEDQGDDGRYLGTDNWNENFYRIVNDNGSKNAAVIQVLGDDETTDVRTVTFYGIQVGVFFSANVNNGIRLFGVEATASGTVRVENCRLRFDAGANDAGFPRILRLDSGVTSDVTLEIIQNLVTVNCDGAELASCINHNDANGTIFCYNNTVYYSDGDGEDFFDDNNNAVTSTHVNNVLRADGTGQIEIDAIGTVTKTNNATPEAADRGGGWDVANADFTSAGVAFADNLTPSATQTNAWDASSVTNADDSRVPTTDIRGNARNTGVGETTAAGCFARTDEGGGGQTVAIGLATERGTPQALTHAKDREVGLATEHGTPQATGVLKTIPIGLLSERGAPQALTHARARAVGLATEQGTVLTPDRLKELLIGLTTERGSPQALTHAKALEVGLVTERGEVPALGTGGTVTIGQVTERGTPLSVSPSKTLAVGLIAEHGTPQQLASGSVVSIGLITESGQPLTVAAAKALSLGLVTERGVVLAPAAQKLIQMGLVTETGEPLPLSAGSGISIGQATEHGTPQTLGWAKSFEIGLVTEYGTPRSIVTTGVLPIPGRWLIYDADPGYVITDADADWVIKDG